MFDPKDNITNLGLNVPLFCIIIVYSIVVPEEMFLCQHLMVLISYLVPLLAMSLDNLWLQIMGIVFQLFSI